MIPISPALLDSYLDKHIDSICPTRFVAHNHCAHFVGHALNLRFGYTCNSKSGVNVRVHETFRRCPAVEALNECRMDYGSGLLFVTGVKNVKLSSQTMSNVPKKHIGIVCGAFVWHYSNSRHRVVKEVADQFIYHYKRQRNGLWLGDIPKAATPHAFGE